MRVTIPCQMASVPLAHAPLGVCKLRALCVLATNLRAACVFPILHGALVDNAYHTPSHWRIPEVPLIGHHQDHNISKTMQAITPNSIPTIININITNINITNVNIDIKDI